LAVVAYVVVTYVHSVNLKFVVEVTVLSVVEMARNDAGYDQQTSVAAILLVLPSELTHHLTLTSANYYQL